MNLTNNAYISHPHKLLVFWSEKAACTSIKYWFSGSVLEMGIQKLLTGQYTQPYRDAVQYLQKGYTTVFVCRNPYHRATSAFISKFYYRPRFFALESFDKLEGIAQDLYLTTKSLDPFFGWSFDEYLRAIRLAMFKSKCIDGHWDTQLPRNCKTRFDPDFLIRVENFDRDLSHVNQSLGFPEYVPGNENRTRYHKSFRESEKLLDKVPSVQLLEERIALKPHNLLSNDSTKLIRKMYAEDFAYFGYDSGAGHPGTMK
jgi:hypothetical protein